MKLEQATLGGLECIVCSVEGAAVRAAAILCHGFGAPSDDLVPIAFDLVTRDTSLDEYVFIFPAAPLELEPGFGGRAWWPINFATLEAMALRGEYSDLFEAVPPGLGDRRNEIETLIANVKNVYDIPTQRVVVGGFSQGAMLTTDVFLEAADPLGGLIIWSGTLINRSRWRDRSAQHRNLRGMQSHGRYDPILPFAGALELRDLLMAGGHSVDFVPFAGQHGIAESALDGAARLLKQAI